MMLTRPQPACVHISTFLREWLHLWNPELMDWLQDEKREGVPQGFIGFAISARMSAELRGAVEEMKEGEWQACRQKDAEVIREWAEVGYVPSAGYEQKGKVE